MTRREVTSKAGIKESASMTTEAALAISQLRTQSKFLKSSGLTLPNHEVTSVVLALPTGHHTPVHATVRP
ncbi:hypothetical protein RRG08_066893 [Elysia crispata]|uniref:Uncharacterized protein n=1 Tax=Elysia crispata TaxID=231223 RepID=A0AAE0Z4R5_9GAST|nr:hypothetical protein RRG08_066893 [Elysia crispata]